MPKRQTSFPDLVAEARGRELERYGDGLAAVQGPPAGASALSDEQLVELFFYRDPRVPDAALLTRPAEQGGAGLTPFQASLVAYPYRGPLLESAGGIDSEEACALAERCQRLRARQQAAERAGEEVEG